MKVKLFVVLLLFAVAAGTGLLANKATSAASGECSTGSCYVTGECCGFCD